MERFGEPRLTLSSRAYARTTDECPRVVAVCARPRGACATAVCTRLDTAFDVFRRALHDLALALTIMFLVRPVLFQVCASFCAKGAAALAVRLEHRERA